MKTKLKWKSTVYEFFFFILFVKWYFHLVHYHNSLERVNNIVIMYSKCIPVFIHEYACNVNCLNILIRAYTQLYILRTYFRQKMCNSMCKLWINYYDMCNVYIYTYYSVYLGTKMISQRFVRKTITKHNYAFSSIQII